MKRVAFAGAACLIAALMSACAEPPVKPIPEAARRSITAVSGDVSGIKDSDTSTLGARGSDEGGKLGATQEATRTARSAGLIGLMLTPVAAIAGATKGAAEAQSAAVVDKTRTSLRLAIQETDFTEMLRQRLNGSKAVGNVEIASITSGASSAPVQTAAGTPVDHVIALEYLLSIYSEPVVNPKVGVRVVVNAQVQSPDRKQMIHRATWAYCSERYDFVQMAADNAASLRAQISNAAAVLGEAIPYDLYVSKEPRKIKGACMDFTDVRSRIRRPPGPARS